MADPNHSAELQRLREQLAELTLRVYQLEELLHARPAEAATLVQPAVVSQAGSSTATSPDTPVITQPGISSLRPRETASAAAQPVLPAEPIKPGRPRLDVSLESRIGGQWLNRVGIVAVLVGLSYFLKLAFDNNWIGPATQVMIGILAGVALLFWSERFRRKGFTGFAFSLKAIGIGALYLSLWAVCQFYHLIPAPVAFFAMVLVTATSATLSLRQNAELLAALALLGGFLTPVLVSTHQNHEVALFSYLALLDLGTVWVMTIKGWRRLLLGSFIGTGLLFGAWASSYYTEPQLPTTLAFATFFFLLYAAAPFLGRRPDEKNAFPNVMVALALLNASFYFATSYLILIDHYRFELAWLAVAIAAFFFVLTRLLQRREVIAGSVYAPLYLALGVGFLTIAIPLKLGGHWNTLGWIIEAGALFWAAHRSQSLLLRWLGVCAFALGVARLMAVDSFAPAALLMNARFGLYLTAIAALGLLAYYVMREGDPRSRQWAAAAILGVNLLALLALHFEVIDYFQPQFIAAYSQAERLSVATVRAFTYSAVWMLYGSGLMVIGFWKRSAFLRWQAIVLLALTVIKVFLFDIGTLQRGYRITAFIVLGAILLAVSFFYQRSRLKTAE
ncbi:MAG: DUF2339 domain-containing protein [Candidatus Korobacteraceae bacterium]